MARYSWQVVLYSAHVRSRALAHAPFGLFHFRWKIEMRKWLVNNNSVYFFPLRAFWSMVLWRKRPERKDEVHEFPVWNVHEAHGRSTAVGRNAPSHTQTIILQVVYLPAEATCIDEFRMVLGGQPTPFCFYPVSRVTRNYETRRHQQLQL